MTADGCAEVRLSLGAYVLGALDPADRSRVDAHLGGCADCRDELASFAALPGLLGRVSRSEVESEPVDPGPQLLERLLGAAAAERRHDRRRRILTSIAAAVIALAAIGVSVGVGVTHDHHPASSATAPVPSGTPESFSATDPTTHVQATVTEWKKGWGASVEVSVVGVTADLAGPSCQLIAVGPDGKTDVAASWAAPAAGYSGLSKVNASGSTALAAKDISAFKVVGSDGKTLVWVPATWST
ncbi:MAG TPA: anti-sigma factor [Acidothermaceae bacterium]|nr:anti-sigma factor [Acidothermaceae bacterium]